jgi:hypothetical protein
VYFIVYLCVCMQRIGRYDQHSADQLNVDVSAVEYMMVSGRVCW